MFNYPFFSLKHPLPETYSPLVLACQKLIDAPYIVAGSTAFSRCLLPRVAVKLDSSLISDVISIIGPDTFKRTIYAGNAVLTLRSLVSFIFYHPLQISAAYVNQTPALPMWFFRPLWPAFTIINHNQIIWITCS